MRRVRRKLAKLVLVRHGESIANRDNVYTGWNDVPLSKKGIEQAKNAGLKVEKIAGFVPTHIHTSVLSRAIMTANIIADVCSFLYLPITKTWRLNERHYGALQGHNKQKAAEKYGDEQVHIWRRSYDVLPPAIDDDNEYSQAHDRRYANLDPHIVPKAENLHVTLDRVMPFWEDHIAPDLLDGKNVIIAAHGNSLRALTKYIENISDDDIMDLEMKTGEPVVYTFDDKLDVVNKEKLDD